MDLEEHKVQLQSILEMEMKGAIILGGDKLSLFKKLLNTEWIPESIYYNMANLIVTDNEEYEKLKQFVVKVEDLFKIESQSFNLYCYIINIANCPKLKSILD